MKKYYLVSFLTYLVLLVTSGCKDSEYEKLLPGTYVCQKSIDEEDNGIPIKGSANLETVFGTDKSLTTSGTFIYNMVISDEGSTDEIQYEFEIKASGTWEIAGDKLMQTVKEADVILADFQAERSDRVTHFMTEYGKDMAASLKKSFIGTSEDKILSLDDRQLVLENMEKGKETWVRK